jgi:hypothetical protein
LSALPRGGEYLAGPAQSSYVSGGSLVATGISMRRALIAVVTAAALSACGSSTDPVSACKTVIEIFCNKDFQCYPNESQILYGSLSNCVSTRQAASCTAAQANCPAGTSFNSSKADQCVEGYRNWSCTDLLNGNIPAVCNETCT